MSLFRRLYAWIGERTFFRWPGPVTEAAGGLVLGLLGLGLAGATGSLPLWFRTLALGTAGNAVYALKLDPADAGKPSEVPDALLREVLVMLVAAAVRVVASWL